MNERKKSYPPINMGISLLITVFITLCFVVFSVLSLSVSLKDYNYSRKHAERTAAYYEACNEAESLLASLHRTPPEALEGELLEYQSPIDSAKRLLVVVEVTDPDLPEYRIVTWKKISADEWNGALTLPVLGSDPSNE